MKRINTNKIDRYTFYNNPEYLWYFNDFTAWFNQQVSLKKWYL